MIRRNEPLIAKGNHAAVEYRIHNAALRKNQNNFHESDTLPPNFVNGKFLTPAQKGL